MIINYYERFVKFEIDINLFTYRANELFVLCDDTLHTDMFQTCSKVIQLLFKFCEVLKF